MSTYLQLGIIIRPLNQVHQSRKPSLLLDRLVRLATPLLVQPRIPARMLDALFDQHAESLQNPVQILRRRDLGLVLQDVPDDLGSDSPSSGIRLRGKERNIVRQSQCCEDGGV